MEQRGLMSSGDGVTGQADNVASCVRGILPHRGKIVSSFFSQVCPTFANVPGAMGKIDHFACGYGGFGQIEQKFTIVKLACITQRIPEHRLRGHMPTVLRVRVRPAREVRNGNAELPGLFGTERASTA